MQTDSMSLSIKYLTKFSTNLLTSAVSTKTVTPSSRTVYSTICQEERSTALTLSPKYQTSTSRIVHPKGCLEERNITRAVHIGGCLSITVHSYQSLTERRKISIRTPVGSGILISCYLYHGTPKCFNFSNQRLGTIVYDNGTIKVSLSQAKVEDSGEYVLEIRERQHDFM